MNPAPFAFRDFVETIVIAAAGGAVLGLAGVPAGWLSGSMFAAAVAALAGRPLYVPISVARICFVALGITAGSAATPAMLAGMGHWPGSLILVLLALVAITLGAGLYLQIVHGWERKTAMLAAVPGGIAQVLILAAEQKADLRAIAIVQSTRLLVLAMALPTVLGLTGLLGGATVAIAAPPSNVWLELAVLIAGSALAAFLLVRLGFGGALFFGPMVVSAMLHGAGIVHAGLPRWFLDIAMITVGAVSGARFTNTSLKTLMQFLAAALGSFAVTILIVSLFVALVVVLFPLPIADVVLAYSPGAADVMMLLALGLQLDPVFVGAHHLMRLLFVPVFLPLLGKFLARVEAD